MSKFNYAQNKNCSICGKRIGPDVDHKACSKKKQALAKMAKENPAKVRALYPQFFIHGKLS